MVPEVASYQVGRALPGGEEFSQLGENVRYVLGRPSIGVFRRFRGGG